jgi:uncharacterized protein
LRVELPAPATAVVPLFPLPNGALLPGELLPLHVFEPRYRAMLEAVRKGDRLVAIATLLPGWETDYHGAPALADVVGLGRVVKDRLNADGTSDVVLHGMLRGEILEELPGRPFRRARLLLRGDGHRHPAELFRLRRTLLTGIAERLRARQFTFDLTSGFDVGALVDRIASALDLSAEERVEMLQALDLERRVAFLLLLLRDKAHRQQFLEIVPSLHAFSLALQASP